MSMMDDYPDPPRPGWFCQASWFAPYYQREMYRWTCGMCNQSHVGFEEPKELHCS